MLVDPAVINYACSKGYLHYWAKSEIFVNNYANQFLNSVGCVPVDRTSKDHQKLYQSTFDVLELNESIAIFPEGTSHTLPYLGKLREGASFVTIPTLLISPSIRSLYIIRLLSNMQNLYRINRD